MAAMGVDAAVEYVRTGKKPSGYTDTRVTLIAARVSSQPSRIATSGVKTFRSYCSKLSS
jgi:fructose transport system substrate-binding protein